MAYGLGGGFQTICFYRKRYTSIMKITKENAAQMMLLRLVNVFLILKKAMRKLKEEGPLLSKASSEIGPTCHPSSCTASSHFMI